MSASGLSGSPTAKAMSTKIEEIVARVRSFGTTLLKYLVRYVCVGKGRFAAVLMDVNSTPLGAKAAGRLVQLWKARSPLY